VIKSSKLITYSDQLYKSHLYDVLLIHTSVLFFHIIIFNYTTTQSTLSLSFYVIKLFELHGEMKSNHRLTYDYDT